MDFDEQPAIGDLGEVSRLAKVQLQLQRRLIS